MIVGGGTAGWLTAAYLAKALELSPGGRLEITLVESPDIGIIGVGEGAFPTIRTTLHFLGIDEMQSIRKTSATFKQGIRFTDWLDPPNGDAHSHYFHPFEAAFYTEGASLVPYWLLRDEATRPPFAEAMTFQNRMAEAKRGPKRPNEGDHQGPLNYASFRRGENVATARRTRARTGGASCCGPAARQPHRCTVEFEQRECRDEQALPRGARCPGRDGGICTARSGSTQFEDHRRVEEVHQR